MDNSVTNSVSFFARWCEKDLQSQFVKDLHIVSNEVAEKFESSPSCLIVAVAGVVHEAHRYAETVKDVDFAENPGAFQHGFDKAKERGIKLAAEWLTRGRGDRSLAKIRLLAHPFTSEKAREILEETMRSAHVL